MPDECVPSSLNEQSYRKSAVDAFLVLLAASIRISEERHGTEQPLRTRDDLYFRLRQSPFLNQLSAPARQDLDEMRDFLEYALKSEHLRIADETPEGPAH